MKKFSKFFILFLCCALLVVTIVRPVQVNASFAATVAIGVAGTVKVVISSKVLVAIIIAGFGGALGGAFFSDIDEWYDSDPVIRDWADSNAHLVQSGSIISVPSNVYSAIYARYIMYTPVAFNTVRVPYSLTNLDTVTALDVFGVDVLSGTDSSVALGQTNTLLNYANATLSAISNSLLNQSGYFRRIFETTEEWVGNVNDSVSEFGRDIEVWVGNVNSSISTWGRSIDSWIQNVNSNVAGYGASTVQWLKNVNSNLVSKIDSLSSRIVNVVNPSVVMPNTNIFDNVVSQENSLVNNIGNGVSQTDEYWLESGSLLNANLINFLAAGLIFDVFANIPYFQQLLIISVSIGIISAILGIALSSASRQQAEGRSKTKGSQNKGK